MNSASVSRSCETRLLAGRIGEFIAANATLPWSPGKVDCCIVLADWLICQGQDDPASHLRGVYDDEAGFRRIIADAGDLVAVVQYCVRDICRRVETPRGGDIGVLGSAGNINRQFGALYDGHKWLVRTTRGFDPVCATPLAIWRLQCHS